MPGRPTKFLFVSGGVISSLGKGLASASIAALLGVSADCVNVKGKTLEGLGALAGGAGIAVQASCLIERA